MMSTEGGLAKTTLTDGFSQSAAASNAKGRALLARLV
jgi:hypothetical protein